MRGQRNAVARVRALVQITCGIALVLASSRTISAEAGAPLPAAPGNRSLPIVSEHKYRMLARVRPLLFWIGRDDVGGARIKWRGDETGAFGIDLLVGSDPARAPRQINRWGFIAEQVVGADARIIGVMKQSNDASMDEVMAQVLNEGTDSGHVFRAIQGTSSGEEAEAGITTLQVDRDLTFRDIDSLLVLVATGGRLLRPAESRSVALPPGTRPGFLVALREQIAQCVPACGPSAPGRRDVALPAPTSYVYFGAFYGLVMTSAASIPSMTIDNRVYTDLVRSSFEVRSRQTNGVTRFQVTYGTSGALAGVPVHAVYQPRWWFEVQLVLDERAAF